MQSEKLKKPNKLGNEVASFGNMSINNVGYELNVIIASGAQDEFAIDPDKINHTNTRITHQNLLSTQMIGIWHEEVYVLTLPKNPRIGAIVLAPQALKSPAVQEIITDTALNNTGTNRTLW